MSPQVANFDHWVAFAQLRPIFVRSGKLLRIARLEVTSMVLVVVVKLVVHVHWAWHSVLNSFQRNRTVFFVFFLGISGFPLQIGVALDLVLIAALENGVRHDIEHDSN